MRHLLTAIFILISSTALASNLTQAADSLLGVLKNTQSPELRIQIYRNLADIYTESNEARTYLLKMYQEASTIDDRKSMLNALDDILIAGINDYNKDTVAKYTELFEKIATKEELKCLLPFYRMRTFDSRCYSGERDEAVKEEISSQNSKIKAKEDIYNQVASAYNMGTSFYMSDQFTKAIPYLDKAMQLAESLPEKDKYIYKKFITWRVCFTYAQAGKSKEAVKIMEQLINMVEYKYKTDYQKQRPFYNIDLYLLQYYSFMISSLPVLTLEQEKSYWRRIQEIGKSLTNDLDKYNYYLCANNYYSNNRTERDFLKAIAANDSLIKFATILAPQNLPGLYNINSMTYEAIKDYQNALKYLKISHQIQDSLNTEATHKQLNELQVKYDMNALNNEKTMLEIKNKKTMLISLSILLIIVVAICTYLYFSWKKEKRMKMELKALHLKAQESEKMKQSFINSICHEIRTPLNAIVGFSDLIMNEEIDAEMRKEFPPEIQKNTVLLTSLINSMLEVANLDVSEEKLPCKPIDIKNICVHEMKQLKKKEGIEYKLEITEESMIIPSNAQYLTQVIEHLLSNANKFTGKGQITLGYRVNQSKEEISIYVSDTGCGIPQEKHEEVFNRFSKLDTFMPGNGLGLYLCRLITKRLAGEIKIDPAYKEGTRMVVTLPIK
ncbi:ATP-binding protein [Bacteroides intestinalis]|jgi:signal transduction histidine kinase|uniref:ATP-binding protein n=1 Tax=Bacteroides intestinalis TaxID=329854 RepID=UPI00189E164F|nr:tetratricopeptide repeat-containing sensor histidine kinase [Bacteroides intestinalis]